MGGRVVLDAHADVVSAPSDQPADSGRARRQRSIKGAVAPRLLTAQAAAAYLGVPYTTLRDWTLRGHLPVVRPPDCRRWWFDRRDLDRAIDAWRERRDS